MDKRKLLEDKFDLIEEMQTLHYQLTDDASLDNYSIDRIVLHIEEVLERYDALDY